MPQNGKIHGKFAQENITRLKLSFEVISKLNWGYY